MKLLLTILSMWAITSQAQTPSLYDKVLLGKIVVLENTTAVLTKRVDTLIWANTKMLALIQLQDEKIKALESRLQAFENGIVKSNQIVGYWPIIVRDSTATIKVIEYIKP